MIHLSNKTQAHALLDRVFQEFLPKWGMAQRPAQLALSHRMLDTMLDDTIALCDAGTGTGKTYAYLVAGLIAQRYRLDQGLIPTPLLISTSSIALQNAILGDYLPVLSNVFLRADLADAPIQAVIRKGKAHYVCDQRLEKRLRQIRKSGKNHQAVKALLALRDRLDSSEVPHLRPYDRMRVQVPAACHCKEQVCRYRLFLRSCQTNRFQIQICNHNLLLADAIHRSEQLRPILPSSSILIVDEAHKLVDAARQMFGSVLTSEDLRTLTYQLRRERYLLAAEFWKHAAQPLLDKLEEPADGEDIQAYRPLLTEPYRLLQRMQRQLYGLLSRSTQNLLDHIRSMLQLLGDDHADLLAYPASNGRNGINLCIASLNLQDHLQETLWNLDRSMILTSGTLAVGGSFQHFRSTVGLNWDLNVTESLTPSPFDYRRNCLLYLPPPAPALPVDESGYYELLTAQVTDLLLASHGHGLILLTSYEAAASLTERLQASRLTFPLFTMGKHAYRMTEQFKASPGAVLLATGAAWEGLDFPGDCVSMLIIPKLPFSFPDAMRRQEQEKYPNLHAYLRQVAVPEMQMKLKQGFGRAIRTESDTCVVAILDERAQRGRRYFEAVCTALPQMPITSSLRTVKHFFLDHKSESYFQEGNQHGILHKL